MNIHAITYKNIWPFAGDPRTVRFSVWNHLVKAPIGSWKSFLFFDGPLFALYKWSKRPMLHRLSERGSIVLIRSDYGNVYAVERELKATKLGNDSVTSRLYVINRRDEIKERWLNDLHIDEGGEVTSGESDISVHIDAALRHICPEWLSTNIDILPRIKQHSEEVIFSSQSDLEQHLQEILPPREVVLNLHFLMQDHENVFDVWPSERVTVFKHLFGLLWIDEWKERLAEKKREIQLMLKVKSDTDQFDGKLRKYLKELLETQSSLEKMHRPQGHQTDVSENFLRERVMRISRDADMAFVSEQVHIDQFTREGEKYKELQIVAEEIKVQRDTVIAIYEQIKTLQSQYKEMTQAVERTDQEISQKTKEIQQLEGELALDTWAQEQEMYAKKAALILEQKNLVTWDERTYMKEIGVEIDTFIGYYQWLKQILARGKELKREIQLYEDRVVQARKQHEEIQKKREAAQQQLQVLENQYAGQLEFRCEKIQDQCPYVEVIKWAALVSLRQQKLYLQEQIAQLTKEENAYQQYGDMRAGLSDVWAWGANDIAAMQEEMTILTKHISHLDWKTLDQRYESYQMYDHQMIQLDKEIAHFADQRRQREQLLERYHQKKWDMSALQQQALYTKQQGEQLVERIKKLHQQLSGPWEWDNRWDVGKNIVHWDVAAYDNVLWSIDILLRTSESIESLVRDYTQTKYEVKQLQEKEKMLTDLANIFSKELLLLVLQDFLPSLQEVMNSYLAQLVDYTVQFELQKSASDKLELEITVTDAYGKRPIKSLSGGQRTILKLVRILSVASMMHTQYLFLDETINNLDVDAIGKVAELLEEYMRARQIKLYLVTHAPQIQEMSLRDSTVVLG